MRLHLLLSRSHPGYELWLAWAIRPESRRDEDRAVARFFPAESHLGAEPTCSAACKRRGLRASARARSSRTASASHDPPQQHAVPLTPHDLRIPRL